MVYPVVLAGGSGTRLWPLSQPGLPKPFLSFHSQQSMFQETVQVLQSLTACRPPLVAVNRIFEALMVEQAQAVQAELGPVLLESAERGTAPIVAMAAMVLLETDPEAILLVCPTDATLANPDAFQSSLSQAVVLAQQGYLVTFGVRPTRAETGYGYIQCKALIEGIAQGFTVSRFVEKPDADRAKQFLDSGDYLWNSGFFVFQARQYLDELAHIQPELLAECHRTLSGSPRSGNTIELGAPATDHVASIDEAVMEKTTRAAVLVTDIGWEDKGSWNALWEASPKDSQGNVVQGQAVLHDVQDSYVYCSGTKTLVLSGLSDVVVVDTPDALLIIPRLAGQQVKMWVGQLQQTMGGS